MKKTLLFGAFLLLAIISYNFKGRLIKPEKPASTTQKANSANTNVTLNNLSEHDAKAMMAYYAANKKNYKFAKKESFWFDRTTINNMVSMLDREVAGEHMKPGSKGITDGIRLYFVADTNPKNGFRTTIQFVSTKYFGSNNKHYDYYSHAKNSALLGENSQEINGTSERHSITTSLRNIFNLYYRLIGDDNQTCDNPHSIKRGLAYQMVSQYEAAPATSTAEWFDLCFFESIAADKVNNIDGIRIYFAKHPKDLSDPDHLKEAFIIVPTVPTKILGRIYHADNYKICLPTCKVSNSSTPKELYDKGAICPENCNLDSNGDGGKRTLLKKSINK